MYLQCKISPRGLFQHNENFKISILHLHLEITGKGPGGDFIGHNYRY